MPKTNSKSRQIIKTLDRETLEAAFFVAAAMIRGIAKGEMQPPPIHVDRTGITVSIIQIAKMLISEDAPEVEVTDVTQAFDIIKKIANGSDA